MAEPEDIEKKKELIRKKLALINVSISNAVKKLNEGAVISAAAIDELHNKKEQLTAELKRLEEGLVEEQADSGPESPAPDYENQDVGIPAELRIKRYYTLSPDALEQRRQAAKRPKPGNVDAQKGNKNAWKHGQFAGDYVTKFMKPCRKTCPDYPCEIVVEGGTKPGNECLDVAEVVKGYRAIKEAIDNKQFTAFNDLNQLTLAKVYQTINMLLDDIVRDGTMAKKQKFDKNGEPVGFEVVPHPSLFALPKLLADLGLTPAEFLITPQAIAKNKVEKKKAKSLADIFTSFGGTASDDEEDE
jgi:hypothetical protein